MNKKLILVVCLMLLATGLLSGCFDKKTMQGEIIEIQSFGGGFGRADGVTLIFDDGRIIRITEGIDKVILNKTGVFKFSSLYFQSVDKWTLEKVVWLEVDT